MKNFLRFFIATVVCLNLSVASAALIVKEQDLKAQENTKQDVISRIDIFNIQMKEFNLLDLDNDGLITKEELRKIGFPEEAISSLFALLDEDKSFGIKKSEVLYRISKEFDLIDENQDGNLDIEELKKYLVSVVPVVILEDNKFYEFNEPLIYNDSKSDENHICPYEKKHKHHKNCNMKHHHKYHKNHKDNKCESHK